MVNEFKLLGVTLDSKLNFKTYCSLVKKSVIRKLYSIKRLFYLCDSVKLQFFKTFVAPHFDYCSSLYIYFPKVSIQKLFSCYNYCLYKLLRINTSESDQNIFNSNLENKFNLNSFIHRNIIKNTTFIHKIINNNHSPSDLKSKLKSNKDLMTTQNSTANQTKLTHTYSLRNLSHVNEKYKLMNHYGEYNFSFFYPKLINKLILNDINLNFTFFEKIIRNNVNRLFSKFVKIFPRFNITFKT